MLNRRHLRVKVMHALYAFFQSNNTDIKKGEKELLFSIEKIYDLYLFLLLIIPEIADTARKMIEEARLKKLPTYEDLHPNTKFVDNKLIAQLSANRELYQKAEHKKINWQKEGELVKKLFLAIKSGEEYTEYMNSSDDNSYKKDQQFIIKIFQRYISNFELLLHFFEEKSIYWIDDFELVNHAIIKTLGAFKEHNSYGAALMTLYKNEEDDKAFVIDLFRKTILHDKEYEKLIATKTQNWEVERIALMDILLMKMAIAEILNVPSIPVKVSLNEYIELSKKYSTPRSNIFVNGILDKLIFDFKKEEKLYKTGRGLME